MQIERWPGGHATQLANDRQAIPAVVQKHGREYGKRALSTRILELQGAVLQMCDTFWPCGCCRRLSQATNQASSSPFPRGQRSGQLRDAAGNSRLLFLVLRLYIQPGPSDESPSPCLYEAHFCSTRPVSITRSPQARLATLAGLRGNARTVKNHSTQGATSPALCAIGQCQVGLGRGNLR